MEIIGVETHKRNLVPHDRGGHHDPSRSRALGVSTHKVMENDPGTAPIHDELLTAWPMIEEARTRMCTAHRVATGIAGTLGRRHACSG